MEPILLEHVKRWQCELQILHRGCGNVVVSQTLCRMDLTQGGVPENVTGI